jgi:putative oxidoreductase
MTWLNDYIPLLLRLCLVALFPFSALDKMLNWESAMKQAGGIPLPRAMLVVSIVVEFVAPVCIVVGWHDRLAAFVLAGFCVITAILFHQFWRFPDFWRFKEGEGLQHFWEFLKNFGLVGGLGFIVLGATPLSITEAAQNPLVSTHVIGLRTGIPIAPPP